MTKRVDFNHSDEMLVTQITARWILIVAKRGGSKPDAFCVRMDLMAANGVNENCVLDLCKLMDFDDFNFAHDMAGIERHMDRETGMLGDCFLPRCAAPEIAAA